MSFRGVQGHRDMLCIAGKNDSYQVPQVLYKKQFTLFAEFSDSPISSNGIISSFVGFHSTVPVSLALIIGPRLSAISMPRGTRKNGLQFPHLLLYWKLLRSTQNGNIIKRHTL